MLRFAHPEQSLCHVFPLLGQLRRALVGAFALGWCTSSSSALREEDFQEPSSVAGQAGG